MGSNSEHSKNDGDNELNVSVGCRSPTINDGNNDVDAGLDEMNDGGDQDVVIDSEDQEDVKYRYFS
jgi:hypothetical protein